MYKRSLGKINGLALLECYFYWGLDMEIYHYIKI